MTSIADEPEYRALLRFAAHVGDDPALVQAAGGNVSIKHRGVLWVKASGTWLAHAETRDIMVPVRLDPLLEIVRGADQDAAENTAQFVIAKDNPRGLRPSIETTMHGALPHRVVVHVHCVETIARACLQEAEQRIGRLLDGVRWAFIPYVRPGAPLTRAILDRVSPDTDVLILGSHGLTVGADTTQQAAGLVAEVSRRLRVSPRPAPAPDTDALLRAAPGPEWVPAADPLAHGIATDPAALAVARRGSLYPDHVIFLGPGIVEPPHDTPAPMRVVPGAGVLLRQEASAGVPPLARCLADVTARIDPADALRVFSAREEGELMNWDAEKYRQTLNAK